MKPQNLKLVPDTAVQLQFEGLEDQRLASRIIGYLPNRTILVTTPIHNNLPVIAKTDQKVTVRFFSNTVACAFESRVISVCKHPFQYLHLAYPDVIASDEVRKARRISTSLDATVYNAGSKQRHNAVIEDISTSGLRLKSDKAMGRKNERIEIRTTIKIAHIKRLINIQGIIRSKNLNPADIDNYVYGIELIELLDEDFLLISSFIASEIAEGSAATG